jgi:hypothetical protein
MTKWMVTSNTPGYLSEDDEPFVTEDETEARQYLADMIEHDWEQDAQFVDLDNYADIAESAAGIDGRYLPAHTEVNLISLPGGVHVPGPSSQRYPLGRNYSISIVEE